MTTSIWPIAAVPTIAASGSIELNESLESVCGATSWQTTTSTPVASQIVMKRDEKRRLLASAESLRRDASALRRPGSEGGGEAAMRRLYSRWKMISITDFNADRR